VVRVLARAARTRLSRQIRNAASVLPEPVGAEIRTLRPVRIFRQPAIWGSVGFPKRLVNHSATRGSNSASIVLIIERDLFERHQPHPAPFGELHADRVARTLSLSVCRPRTYAGTFGRRRTALSGSRT